MSQSSDHSDYRPGSASARDGVLGRLSARLEAADDRRILRQWPRMLQRGPRWFAVQRAASYALRLALIAPIVLVLDLGQVALSMRRLSVSVGSFVVLFAGFYVLSGWTGAFEWRRRGERYAQLTGDLTARRHLDAADQVALEPVLGGLALSAILVALWAARSALTDGSSAMSALVVVSLLLASIFAGRLVQLVRRLPFQRDGVSGAVGT